MCDPKKVIKLLEDAGFHNIILWNQYFGYNFTDFEKYYQNRLATISKIHMKMKDNKIKDLKDEIQEQFHNQIKKGIPVGEDVLFIVGTK